MLDALIRNYETSFDINAGKNAKSLTGIYREPERGASRMLDKESGRGLDEGASRGSVSKSSNASAENNLPAIFYAHTMMEGYAAREKADALMDWVLGKMDLGRSLIWPASDGIIPNSAPLDLTSKRWFVTQYFAVKTLRLYIENYLDKDTGSKHGI